MRPSIHMEGFDYSDAMVDKGKEGMTWTFENLDHFLDNPKGFIPGTAMAFAGVKKPDERANVIAYLRTLSDNPGANAAADPGADRRGPPRRQARRSTARCHGDAAARKPPRPSRLPAPAADRRRNPSPNAGGDSPERRPRRPRRSGHGAGRIRRRVFRRLRRGCPGASPGAPRRSIPDAAPAPAEPPATEAPAQ